MKHTAFLVVFFVTISVFSQGYKTKNDAYLPTSLRITVIDGLGNYVEGANVAIYNNEEDFKNSENPVQEPQLTNEKGIVTFKDIEAIAYYVDVTKDKMSNYGGAQLTPELKAGRMNKVNIVIE